MHKNILKITQQMNSMFSHSNLFEQFLYIPRCIDCKNFSQSNKKCKIYKVSSFEARLNQNKCGISAKDFS